MGKGFTIIESLLFLAITGLMMATLLVGTTVSLNNQRYNDSVVSLKSLLQEQFSELTNTQNERPDDWYCGYESGGIVIEERIGTSETAGQGDCELVGRYVLITDTDVAVYSVVAYRVESQEPSTTSDVVRMQDADYFRLGLDTTFVNETEIEWGAQIAWPVEENGEPHTGDTSPRQLSILFVRSPETGAIYTFTGDDVVTDVNSITEAEIRSLITVEANQAGASICIDSNGLTFVNDKMVYIAPRATSSNAIEVRTNSLNEQDGVATRC